jgi:hypothetical protein
MLANTHASKVEAVMLLRSFSIFLPIVLFSFPAVADTVVPIDFGLTALGNGEYRYDYSVYNNGSLGAGVPIQLFDIFFDATLYGNLSIVSPDPPASQWSQMILDSVGTVPAFYDVEATSGGISAGSTVSGFAVDFTWLGQGVPGSQEFQIYSNTFNLLQTGNTTSETPEPSTFLTIGILLACAAARRVAGSKRS